MEVIEKTESQEKKSFNGLRISDPALNGWIIEKEYGSHVVYHPEKPKSLVRLQNLEQCMQHIIEMQIQEVKGEYTLKEYTEIIKGIYDHIQGNKEQK